MISPAKILLLALCVTVFVAYFGEKFMLVNNKVAEDRLVTGSQPFKDPVATNPNRTSYGGEVYISISKDGHYWTTLNVNGTPVQFVVDTGASHISLSYEDARAAGLVPSSLNYNQIFNTANGTTRKAMVKLDSVTLDTIQVSNILASVSQQGQMGVSLLGMNFLNRLSGFNVENREMILKP